MKKFLLFQILLAIFINYNLFSQNNKNNENVNTGSTLDESIDFSINLKSTKALPVAHFNYSEPKICVGEYVTFNDSSYNAPEKWEWTFEGGTPSSSDLKNPPNIYYYIAGTYSVELIVNNGEGNDTLIKTKLVVVGCNYTFIPNIFTPNDDGRNDVLIIRGPDIKEMNMKIYDRWGKKVFEISNKEDVWDGKIDGKKAEQGTYVYYVDVVYKDGETTRIKGDFSLIR